MLFERQVARRPDKYPWARPFIEAMHEGFWTSKKFSFETDRTDYKFKMTDEEREITKKTLAAIAQIEIAVKEFWAKLGQNLPHPSMTDLGITMANIEVIHNNAYEKLLEVLDLEDVFVENMHVPALANRVRYLTKHNDKVYTEDARKQYVYSLILFTLFVENVSLFNQFYILLWLNRENNYLKDTTQQVKYTRNEEDLHARAGMKIINTLREEYPELFDADLEARIVEECHEAMQAEAALIDWILGDFEGDKLNAAILKDYVAIRLNESLEGIGYSAIYDVPQSSVDATFWMTEGQYAPARVDFFSTEPTSYSQNDTTLDDEF